MFPLLLEVDLVILGFRKKNASRGSEVSCNIVAANAATIFDVASDDAITY